ncbi:MAG: Ig-like domain-containing protein [Rikenellaceae bacterium]|jgi:hypothetical protein|nr:Ig-like domain-containing protein [Rikenellaceae bacterium]
MKNRFLWIAVAGLLSLGLLNSCKKGEEPPKTVSVTDVRLNKTSLSLAEGASETLTATVAPENATNKAVAWTSSDATVATVDDSGKVMALKAGTAVVIVTTADGGKIAICTVTVMGEPDEPDEPEIDDVLPLIPDATFLAYCQGQMGTWDTNGDGKLSSAEAAAVTSMDLFYMDIASLAGIEYFTGLTYLDAGWNQLRSLDVSKNTALTTLYLAFNQLTALDVSKNTALTALSVADNQLAALDVSANTALTALTCNNNQLSSLDVSNNTALTDLSCFSNPLTAIDLSANTALTTLSISDTRLTALDVSNNTALTYLDCPVSQLISLDITQNSALTWFNCMNNPGDGEQRILVKAWFDNDAIPAGFSGNDYEMTGSWKNGRRTIKVVYYVDTPPEPEPIEPIVPGPNSGGYALKLSNEIAGSDVWSAQVWYHLSARLTAGVSYTYTFMVKGTENYDMQIYLQDPAYNDGTNQEYPPTVAFGTEWEPVSTTFVPTGSTLERIAFNFGDFVGDIWIDNISLTAEGSDVNLIANSDFEAEHTNGWASHNAINLSLSFDGEGYRPAEVE